MEKKLKILVVDDTPENLVLMTYFIAALGHDTITATNGLEAVAAFAEHMPDMVLMDVMMPVMDGYEATTQIKVIAGDKWIPIIFLSALSQDADQVKGLGVGGDDFITKPVNLTILSAKIMAMQRIAEMQQKITRYSNELERYRDTNEYEQQLAKHLLDKMIRKNVSENILINSWLMPAERLSGDVCVSAFTPGNSLYVLLADATGHGLVAAINVMPVLEIFYGMVEKGFALPSIVSELNRKIKMLLPTERFIAATLLAINPVERTVEIWNAGNPDAFFLSDQGDIIRTWKSNHPALGILNEAMLDNRTEVFQWSESGQIFLCSDGLIEAENKAGKQFGRDRMFNVLLNQPASRRLPSIIEAVQDHLDGKPGQDDISIVTILCPAEYQHSEKLVSMGAEHSLAIAADAQWRLELSLSSEQLKTLDIPPLLLGWLDQLQLHKEQRGKVFLIFSELINNAMDHGILALNSKLKNSPEGFEAYLSERNLRLKNLQNASMTISIERFYKHGQDLIQIHILDSGNGFSSEVQASGFDDFSVPSGRGLLLVKSMCHELTFLGKGNEVIAVCQL